MGVSLRFSSVSHCAEADEATAVCGRECEQRGLTVCVCGGGALLKALIPGRRGANRVGDVTQWALTW